MSFGWAVGCALAALLAWFAVLIAPWRPWSTRECLAAGATRQRESLDDVTVLIPARDEAETLPKTLASLAEQGPGLDILVVDDQSCDSTREIAQGSGVAGVRVISGAALPEGWTGKVWAQAQARPFLHRPLVLLLDADIALAPGLIATLRTRLRERRLGLASLMAELPMEGFWERLLMPAFIYFFKLVYPFRVANSPSKRVAAAAGGCVLLELRALDAAGGFASLRDAIIDDCMLARRVKDAGFGTWIGLTRSVTSHRRYRGLGDIWRMVTRTAFTQLRYSWLLLALCTLLMVICFLSPVLIAFSPEPSARAIAVTAWFFMWLAYLPTLRFYRLPAAWGLLMPFTGLLFLIMTWDSARRYLLGERSAWRGRRYAAGRENVSR
ncbi:MAG: glycosyltransferase [Gammaproteobacteria bacterium]|nr:MAG: glycosyltransferase [Gammaproteobacteria bacterium]